MTVPERDELVARLRAVGLVASARDWALGETIFVSHPSLAEHANGITIYREALHIRRDGDRWLIVADLSKPGQVPVCPGSSNELIDYLRTRFIEAGRPRTPG